MKVLLFLLAFVVAVTFGSKCDPQLKRANFLNTVEEIRDNLMKGTSKSHTPALDPYHHPYPIHTNYQGMDVNMYNIEVKGARDLKIENLSLNISGHSYALKATVVMPELTITANYKFGKPIFIIFHAVETGHLHALFTGIKAELNIVATPITKDGRIYDLQPEHNSVLLDIGDGSVSLDGGFMGSLVESTFKLNKRSKLNELRSKIKLMIETYIQDVLDEKCS